MGSAGLVYQSEIAVVLDSALYRLGVLPQVAAVSLNWHARYLDVRQGNHSLRDAAAAAAVARHLYCLSFEVRQS